jgi:hypothetical protein
MFNVIQQRVKNTHEDALRFDPAEDEVRDTTRSGIRVT